MQLTIKLFIASTSVADILTFKIKSLISHDQLDANNLGFYSCGQHPHIKFTHLDFQENLTLAPYMWPTSLYINHIHLALQGSLTLFPTQVANYCTQIIFSWFHDFKFIRLSLNHRVVLSFIIPNFLWIITSQFKPGQYDRLMYPTLL